MTLNGVPPKSHRQGFQDVLDFHCEILIQIETIESNIIFSLKTACLHLSTF